ncbi:hypothetical protein MKUB_10950 [Mycobacterium kubicae]|uniref:CDGP domain-containing protein n=1 Tax=Mycobacterium kubicae TaxID=120959 RepID=A0AAX1JDP0_9MYCO|nr:hypothetical protein [Mycobacterium kubicae]MCV7097995.1 hypothetical protein [Mycobacterium kubicae]OBF14835.1 hypothetical protein A5725_05770 [Mycobacterium kubicae]OBK53438.1 hypothetical protein A5657_15220 [Mycobacterium kubicae]ORW05510.1 hypothetical protein AWC13_25425 [Mycobacterium kubicae]QNI05377.1 hypothetical protein GAN17_03005 [Mycobacterium kubicae]
MKRCIVAAVAALLVAAGLIGSAPSASAGCQYGGPYISKCDGPVQPDGTWQRCVAVAQLIPRGASSFLAPEKHCDVLGPDQSPGDPALADPPMHIDD